MGEPSGELHQGWPTVALISPTSSVLQAMLLAKSVSASRIRHSTPFIYRTIASFAESPRIPAQKASNHPNSRYRRDEMLPADGLDLRCDPYCPFHRNQVLTDDTSRITAPSFRVSTKETDLSGGLRFSWRQSSTVARKESGLPNITQLHEPGGQALQTNR